MLRNVDVCRSPLTAKGWNYVAKANFVDCHSTANPVQLLSPLHIDHPQTIVIFWLRLILLKQTIIDWEHWFSAVLSIDHPVDVLLWKQSCGLSKHPLTAYVSDSSWQAPHISVDALAMDVSIFTNKTAVWIVQTGRPDQLSDSMRLHRMWPTQVGFICHACVLSRDRHRIISSIDSWWWLVGLVLNKHGNDPLTSHRGSSLQGVH